MTPPTRIRASNSSACLSSSTKALVGQCAQMSRSLTMPTSLPPSTTSSSRTFAVRRSARACLRLSFGLMVSEAPVIQACTLQCDIATVLLEWYLHRLCHRECKGESGDKGSGFQGMRRNQRSRYLPPASLRNAELQKSRRQGTPLLPSRFCEKARRFLQG